MRITIILAIHLLAAGAPLLQLTGSRIPAAASTFEWPDHVLELALTPVALTQAESGFLQGFPGEVRRFVATDKEIIIRQTDRATRKLHPSGDCMRGAGFTISPLPARRDSASGLWGCFLAEKGNVGYRVCEQIRDSGGRSWYDVSSWYWSALLEAGSGPWIALTVAEPI